MKQDQTSEEVEQDRLNEEKEVESGLAMCAGEGSSCPQSCGAMGPTTRAYLRTKKATTGYCGGNQGGNKNGGQDGGGGGGDAGGGGAPTDINAFHNPFKQGMDPYKIATNMLMQKGALALAQMPFFAKADFKDLHKELQAQNFILNPMEREVVGLKVKAPQTWTDWALHSINKNKKKVNAQFIYREWYGLFKGETQSPSIYEYEELAEAEKFLTYKDTNEYAYAIRFGLDLFIPEAQAMSDEELREEQDNNTNEEVTSGPLPKASPTPTLYGTPINSIDKNKEQEQHEDSNLTVPDKPIEINKIGKYGPTKMMKYLGLGAGLIGLAVGMMFSAQGQMDKTFGNPLTRGLMMQAVAVLAIVAWSMSKKNLKTVKDNKKYVEDLYNRFKDIDGDAVDPVEGPGRLTQDVTVKGIAVPRQGPGNDDGPPDVEIPCANGAREDGSCIEVDLVEKAKKQSSTFGNLSPQLLGSLSEISGGLNAARDNKVEKAQGEFASLGTKRKAVRNALKEAQKNLNEERRVDGLDPIDFNKEADDLAKQFTKSVEDEARRAGVSLENFGPIADAGASQQSESQDNDSAAAAKAQRKGNSSPYKSKKSKGFKKKRGLFDGLFGSKKVKPKAVIPSAVSEAEELSKYQTELNDVNKREDVSLFRMISGRYMRTAYPQLLEIDDSDNRSSRRRGGGEFNKKAPVEGGKDEN